MMVISAQMRLGGFYTWVTRRVAGLPLPAPLLLAALMAAVLIAAFLLAPLPREVMALAGNLVIVGSIANIIVVDAAARRGIRIDWRTHARFGVPVTLASLPITAA